MRAALVLSLALLASACQLLPADPNRLKPNQHYRVEWIGERPLIDRSYLSLTLGKDGKAFGHAGCNRWFGDYQLQGSTLHIERIATTLSQCAPSLMEQENRYLAALPDVVRWDISATGQLQLWPASGAAIRLWAEPAPADELE
ncbi:MAG: META domain-containing protein [Thiopseudomonas sp.]|nr:META domain-containing protein [Thiopseudomonas sp.]